MPSISCRKRSPEQGNWGTVKVPQTLPALQLVWMDSSSRVEKVPASFLMIPLHDPAIVFVLAAAPGVTVAVATLGVILKAMSSRNSGRVTVTVLPLRVTEVEDRIVVPLLVS